MRGFSLIEMLIAVCIAGILMAVALPGYSSYMRRTHRFEAQAALLRAAQWMERAASVNGQYPPAGSLPANVHEQAGDYYELRLLTPDPLQKRTSSFRILAVRKANSSQADDPCGDLTLDQTGHRDVSDASPTHAAARCWVH